MEGVGNSPPPFLSKTYDMVDDPSIDTVVSWSKSNNSFVVWNVPDFSRDVLPKFFKHNNFSSFVRQLNTYGFRKVDPDRFEFANEGFLKGQKHLLKNISRRKGNHVQSHPQPVQVQSTSTVASCVEVAKFGIEEDVEMLKRDKNSLMQELVRLRQQQQTTDNQLQTVGQRVHVMEQRQQQMMSFLAKAMQSPGFVAQLVHQPNDGNRRISGVNKKRRLHNPGEEDIVRNPGIPSPNGQVVKYEPLMNEAAKAVLRQILKINSSGRLDKKISNPNGFLINGLDIDNSSNRVSGVTLSEVSGLLCDSPSDAISDIQSSPSMVSQVSTEMDAISPQDKAASCLFPSTLIPQYNMDLPDLSLEASMIGNIESNNDAMPGFADDDIMPVVGDSSNPDVDVLVDDTPKLPGINDVFWEQFLAAGPLPGDTYEIDSSILGGCVDKEQDLQTEQENEWDKLKHMNNLTEQMGLLAAASNQV